MARCGLGHRHDGGFLALWTIAYGAVQALASQMLPGKDESESAIIAKAVLWAAPLTPIPITLTARALTTSTPALWFTLTLASGLPLFDLVFAVNSSVHSHLILAFASSDRVSMDVGFYYMANAAARLLGTVLSGISYQIYGLPLYLATARATAAAVWARCTSCGPAPKHDAYCMARRFASASFRVTHLPISNGGQHNQMAILFCDETNTVNDLPDI